MVGLEVKARAVEQQESGGWQHAATHGGGDNARGHQIGRGGGLTAHISSTSRFRTQGRVFDKP